MFKDNRISTSKHIVFLTPGFPATDADSWCLPYLQKNALELAARDGVQLTIISLQYPFQVGTYRWNGIEIYSCGGNNRPMPKRLVSWRRAMRYFKQIHAVNPVTHLHSWWLDEATWLGQRLAKKYQVKHLATAMGQDVVSANRYLKWLRRERLILTGVSTFQETLFKQTTGAGFDAIIPHGLDHQSHDPEERTIDLLGVGSFIEVKAYQTFVDTLIQLQSEGIALKAVLIGRGPQRETLQRQCEEAKLDVQFTGEIPHEEVLGLMRKSKVLLHPAVYESYGFVFTEALACGMSIVSHAVGIAKAGPHWTLVDSTEQFVPAIKQALADFDPNQQPEFDRIETTINQYLELYEGDE